MRLALLVVYYPPSRASAAVQMSDLAVALARQGHDVTVFTSDSDIAASSVRRENGVTVVRARTGPVKGIGHVRRALNETLLSFALWRATRACGVEVGGFDGVIWYSPTIFLAPFARWLKGKSGATGYLILRDIFPQWAVDAGVMRKGLAYRYFRFFERFQYRTADVIGVQSPANLPQVRADTRRSDRLEVLYNWLDLARPDPQPVSWLERRELAGKHILVYGGNMGVAQDMENLLRLALKLRGCPDIAFLFVGAGSDVERMRNAIAERGLANVVLLDEIDPDAFRAVLRSCHVGLITLDRRLTTHNIPGKLLAYLEAGLPVIASINAGNDLITMLNESGAGVALVNGDDEGLARAARELAGDPARREAMSRKARALALERFSVEAVTRQLTRALEPGGEARPASVA